MSVLFMCVSLLGMDEVNMGEERDKRVSEELMDSVVWEKPPDEEKVHTQHTQHTHTTHTHPHITVYLLSLQPDRDVRIGLSVTDTDFVVVEDLNSSSSSAVVLKGTLVLNFRSPPSTSSIPNTLHCTVESLEMFSCSLQNEDETALSIVDPVTIGVELKPLATPNTLSKHLGTHTLEVHVLHKYSVMVEITMHSFIYIVAVG